VVHHFSRGADLSANALYAMAFRDHGEIFACFVREGCGEGCD
jgi:hypothetical protein